MQARPAIYLDYNAGCPLNSAARGALSQWLSADTRSPGHLGNPSSTHSFGRELRTSIRASRESVAKSLGLGPREADAVVFTSSGTEANQLPLQAVMESLFQTQVSPVWALSRESHACVLSLVASFEARGGQVLWLTGGTSDLLSSLRVSHHIDLLSILWANNETGAWVDVKSLAHEARAKGAWVHVDAAQAWGKTVIDVGQLNSDILSFSGHKIGALAGSGAFYLSPRARAVVRGRSLGQGLQENGLRAGTESVVSILALGAAAQAIDVEGWRAHCGRLKQRLLEGLARTDLSLVFHGGSERAENLENTLNFRVRGMEKPGWVQALDLRGVAVSSGAACSAGADQPSHVLLALGMTEAEAKAAIRVSWGWETTVEEVEFFASALVQVAATF